jgi:hypothetical protein
MKDFRKLCVSDFLQEIMKRHIEKVDMRLYVKNTVSGNLNILTDFIETVSEFAHDKCFEDHVAYAKYDPIHELYFWDDEPEGLHSKLLLANNIIEKIDIIVKECNEPYIIGKGYVNIYALCDILKEEYEEISGIPFLAFKTEQHSETITTKQLSTNLNDIQRGLLYDLLVKDAFIPKETDKDGFIWAFGGENGKYTDFKIVWLKNNKQLLRELVLPLMHQDIKVQADYERLVPLVFIDNKGNSNPITLAKNKPIPSLDSDKITAIHKKIATV